MRRLVLEGRCIVRVLQAGYLRSGNYLLWRILQQTFAAAGLPRPSYCQRSPLHDVARSWRLSFLEEADVDILEITPAGTFWVIPPYYRKRIRDIDAYLEQTSHVWTHCSYHPDIAPLAARFNKVIYVLRDVRDAMLSYVEYMNSPFIREEYADFEPIDVSSTVASGHLAQEWRQHLARWLLHGRDMGVHFVVFERLVHAFDEEYADLLAYLGMELDCGAIAQVRREVAFAAMKEVSPGHLGQGKTGRWIRSLDAEQVQRMTSQCGSMLDLLGYPTTTEAALEPGRPLPAVPLAFGAEQLATLRSFAGPAITQAAQPVDTYAAREIDLLGEDLPAQDLTPETMLEHPHSLTTYRLHRSPDDEDDSVFLYFAGLEATMPGDTLPFVVEAVKHTRFSVRDATQWLGDAYDPADVSEILQFLLANRFLRVDR